MDGTPINTEIPFYESYKEVSKNKYNISINPEMYKKCELDRSATLLDTLRKKFISLKDVSDEDIMKEVFKCYTGKFTEVILSSDVQKKFNYLKILK